MMALYCLILWGLFSFGCCLVEPKSLSCGAYSVFKQMAEQEVRIKAMETKIAGLEADITRALANSRCGPVAFRAQLTKDLGTVTLGQRIVYDRVELNIGGAFHPYHSIFNAPCNGTYIFSITIGNSNKAGVVHLKKNDVTVEYAWAGYNSNWDMGGVATIAYLMEGDDVWVEGRGVVYGEDSNDGVGDRKFTAFAGSLLHAF